MATAVCYIDTTELTAVFDEIKSRVPDSGELPEEVAALTQKLLAGDFVCKIEPAAAKGALHYTLKAPQLALDLLAAMRAIEGDQNPV